MSTMQTGLGSLCRLAVIATRGAQQTTCLTRGLQSLAILSRNTAVQPNTIAFGVCLTSVRNKTHSPTWEYKNKTIYPPQKPGEPRRPAEVYYAKRQIKHSHRKMWYVAKFVKGMMIDEALAQLPLINKKAARIVREALLEAQEEAMKNHNVEYKSNLHIADSRAQKGIYQHAIRYHGRGYRFMLNLSYCHYVVCLKEGPPPEPSAYTGYDQAEDYLKKLRRRYIIGGV